MKFKSTHLPPAKLISFEALSDERGSFSRVFCHKTLKEAGLDFTIKQINLSETTTRGTIRGLHFQYPPHEEGKIVRCLRGEIFDVIVDLRKDSTTYGLWQSFILNEHAREALFVPPGFAHGFQTLTDQVMMEYFMSEEYHPESYGGINWQDPELIIDWPLVPTFISDKDKNLPSLKEIKP